MNSEEILCYNQWDGEGYLHLVSREQRDLYRHNINKYILHGECSRRPFG